MKNKLLALTAVILASCTPAYADLSDVQKYITETYRVPQHEADHIIQATIEQAKTHNLNPSVVLGIMETESNFNKNVISSKGARGLMQIMPVHRAKIRTVLSQNGGNIHTPNNNIAVGSMLLKELVEKHGYRRAIMAYFGNMKSNTYLNKVLNNKRNFDRLIEL